MTTQAADGMPQLPKQQYQMGGKGHSDAALHAYAQQHAAALQLEVEGLRAEKERVERNRDMWQSQCTRQAEQLTNMREALRLAVRQNSHDMLMTGDEIRLCEAALVNEQPQGE